MICEIFCEQISTDYSLTLLLKNRLSTLVIDSYISHILVSFLLISARSRPISSLLYLSLHTPKYSLRCQLLLFHFYMSFLYSFSSSIYSKVSHFLYLWKAFLPFIRRQEKYYHLTAICFTIDCQVTK